MADLDILLKEAGVETRREAVRLHELTNRRERVFVVGVVGLIGILMLVQVMPAIVAVVLMAFSIVAFVFGVVGLLKPSWARLPNRAAAVWAWAVSVGLFIGGGMLQAPQNGTASDASVLEERAEHERRLPAAERAAASRRAAEQVQRSPERRREPDRSISDMSPEELNRAWDEYVASRGQQEPDEVDDTMDALEAMISCQSRMQVATWAMLAEGSVFRWTSSRTGDRFNRNRTDPKSTRDG